MKLDEKLVEVIEQAQKFGAEAFLFGKEQIPDVITQLLRWKLVNSLFWSLFGILLFVLSFKFMKKLFSMDKSIIDDIESYIAFYLLLIITSLPGVIFFLTNFTTAIQIYFAPKVYLIEFASNLIKK